MFTLRKFLYCCAVLGVLAVLGTTLLQIAATVPQSKMPGLPSGSGAFLQTASAEAGPAAQRTIAELTANLQSFSNSAGLFVHRNIVTARLQLAYMFNSIPTHFSDWLPHGTPGWIQGGPQVAAQNAGAKANELAKKVPLVSSAVDATSSRFRAVRDSLGNAASF